MFVERKTNMTKWTPADIPSLPGRLAVVIAANSGIGWHTALELAQAGSEMASAAAYASCTMQRKRVRSMMCGYPREKM